MVWKLLIIDPTSQRKLNKIENFYRVFKAFLVLLESPWLGKSELIEFISRFSELRCGRY
jgi:hypothetical protein